MNMINIKKVIEDAFGRVDLSTVKEIEYQLKCFEQAASLNSNAVETLSSALKTGPLWDGDVPSKSGRDDLLDIEAIAKVVVKGEQGFNAATYHGHNVAKARAALMAATDEAKTGVAKNEHLRRRRANNQQLRPLLSDDYLCTAADTDRVYLGFGGR